jgi:crotonobetainyl-CoA:carnitine CoA-transferase CaiB-like acyl-CoA transferase
MGMLDGVRVLDLSRLLPGPAATAWLAGQGARVDRVETPGRGDFTRHMPPFVGGVGAYFAATSLGKRSLAVDLRHPEGRDLIRRIAPTYDVLVEGFKPGVLEEMGLGPDVLLADHPGLIVARLSGFGQDGPWADRPGHDVNYLGLTGALTAQGRDEHGIVVPTVQIADVGAGLLASAGIASALFDRTRTGRGRVLDVSLTEAALWFAGPVVTGATAEGVDPEPGSLPLAGLFPLYGTYRCADGKWLTIGALEAKFQAEVAAVADGRVEREDLVRLFASRPRDAWVEVLSEACVGPALAPSEVADHPHLAARGAVRRAAGTTWVRPPLGELPEGRWPAVGEHTDAVLAEAGLSPVQVEALRTAGAIA